MRFRMCVQRSPSAPKAVPTCRKLRGLLFLPLFVLATTVAVHAETASFADKTIKIIVGMPPGGGVDSYARLVQRHLARFLPGTPTIMVQNMPGAGSLRSMMALANSSDDAIGTFSSSLITEAISVPD